MKQMYIHISNIFDRYKYKIKSDLRILQCKGIVLPAKLVKGAYSATDYIKHPTEIYNKSKYGKNES